MPNELSDILISKSYDYLSGLDYLIACDWSENIAFHNARRVSILELIDSLSNPSVSGFSDISKFLYLKKELSFNLSLEKVMPSLSCTKHLSVSELDNYNQSREECFAKMADEWNIRYLYFEFEKMIGGMHG